MSNLPRPRAQRPSEDASVRRMLKSDAAFFATTAAGSSPAIRAAAGSSACPSGPPWFVAGDAEAGMLAIGWRWCERSAIRTPALLA